MANGVLYTTNTLFHIENNKSLVASDPTVTFTCDSGAYWMIMHIAVSGPTLARNAATGALQSTTVMATVDIEGLVYCTTYQGGGDEADGAPLPLQPSQKLNIIWYGDWPLATVEPLEFRATIIYQAVPF